METKKILFGSGNNWGQMAFLLCKLILVFLDNFLSIFFVNIHIWDIAIISIFSSNLKCIKPVMIKLPSRFQFMFIVLMQT